MIMELGRVSEETKGSGGHGESGANPHG